jgi:tetratricopeptide (TPR) repeat protein
LKKGYKKIPDSALLVTSLAKLYIKGKQYDAAVKLCKDRLKKNDKEAFTWNLLGSIYLAKKELGQAQTAFEKAVKIMPEWGKPYDNLARIYLVKGEKQEAIAEFKAALEKNPENRAAWMILGSIYEKDSKYDKAALIYEEAFENNPGLWAAANNYAFIKAETSTSADELQKAMEFARKADQLKPGAGVILDTLGWIYFKMGDMDKAYENILAAVDQHPDYDMLNYHMGMVLDRLGKISEAKIYLEKSLNSGNDFLGIEIVKQLLKKYKIKN